MTYTYHAHRSHIIDVFYVPLLMEKMEKAEWEMTQKEQDILGDIWQTIEDIKEKLSPLDEDLKRYSLWGEAYSLAHMLYLILLEQGKDPQTVSEVLSLFEAMADEDIKKAYEMTLSRSYIEEKVEDIGLLAYLDKVDMSAEHKWHWYQAINKPKETLAGLSAVLEQVDEVYAPYYEQFAEERQTYLDHFDLEQFFAHLATLGVDDIAKQYQTTYELILLSPIHIRLMTLFLTTEFKQPVWLVISTRMEELIQSRDVLDMDSFSTILKTISDISRYQVLIELIKPHAKNKDIAKQLGITGAAVSFHAQKLINSKLLLFDTEDKSVKYKLNQGLIHQIMEKLYRDFALEPQPDRLQTTRQQAEAIPVVIKNGVWYDKNDRPLTEAEKALVKDQVYAELDKDLKDTGFEGLIKKFVKYLMAKNGKGLGKYLHMSSKELTPNTDTTSSELPTDRHALADELAHLDDDLAAVTAEIDHLGLEVDKLSVTLSRLQAQQEQLEQRRQNLLDAQG